jgi:hypothetical protein
MVDDIILKTILILFFSVYLFQIVAQFVYHYDGDGDEDDDNGQDEDHCNNDDCNDRKVVTVAYEDKFLTKMRDAKRLKDGLLKDGLKDPLDLTHLKNNFVMEYTPVGNVLMYYNVVKECFDYYSDSTIPYRYLEVVSRKYVLINDCVSLYFDMEEELAQCELKNKREKEKEKEIEKEKETDRIDWEEITKNKEEEKGLKDSKKSVFAKFKSYNKEGGTGHVSTAPPPKNNISQVNVKTNNSENICLKERANRYSHQGKILNFSMLQKVDRTKVDKKFAMSYAEFKRLKNMEGIYDKENK